MSTSTVGAGKSGADDKERIGIDSEGALAALALGSFVLFPVATAVYTYAHVVGQVRRVRPSRMAIWFVVATVAALALVGFDAPAILRWQVLGWQRLLQATPWGVGGGAIKLINMTLGVGWAEMHGSRWSALRAALGYMTPAGLILGSLFAVPRVAWASYRRRRLEAFEDSRFDFTRPPGFFDWVRRRRSAKRIQSGRAVSRRKGLVALGTGYYGHVVNVPVAEFQRPTLTFGTIRSGKTVTVCSIIAQAAVGGVLAIDFKGDNAIPAFWAEFAVANNRKFKHFKMAEKSGALYKAPCLGAPDKPACYDPLRHGNADSKSNMLQKSVDREGDAAFYLRNAHELTLVAYQIADVIGVSEGRSGFRVLYDMLDLDTLSEAVGLQNPDTGAPFFDMRNPVHASLIQRVNALKDKTAKDEGFRAAVAGTRTLLSSYLSSAAVGPYLRPGDSIDNDIDLLQAVLQGHVVVFSLPVQDYKDLAKTIGTLVLLDMQNVVSSLRELADQGRTWEPFYVQIEEFGSAGGDAVLDLLNKSGDVQIRPFLSTQSYNDLRRMKDGEAMADSIIDQAGNIFAFSFNDDTGAEKIASMSPQVTKQVPREGVEYSRLSKLSFNIRAANKGDIDAIPTLSRQLTASDLQALGKRKRHDNNNPDANRVYECVWMACYDGKRVTHTFDPHPMHWYEAVKTVLCNPAATAKRFPGQVHPDVPDEPLVSTLDAIDIHERGRRASYQPAPAADPAGDVTVPDDAGGADPFMDPWDDYPGPPPGETNPFVGEAEQGGMGGMGVGSLSPTPVAAQRKKKKGRASAKGTGDLDGATLEQHALPLAPEPAQRPQPAQQPVPQPAQQPVPQPAQPQPVQQYAPQPVQQHPEPVQYAPRPQQPPALPVPPVHRGASDDGGSPPEPTRQRWHGVHFSSSRPADE